MVPRELLLYIIIVSYSYVFAIHIGAKKGDRNDPIIMKSRMKRITIVTMINLILAPWILIYQLQTVPNVEALLEVFGVVNPFSIVSIEAISKTLILFILLFIGPLVNLLVENDLIGQYFTNLEMFRDLVFAPLTEELFYTSFATGSLLASQAVLKYTPTQFHDDYTVTSILKYSPLLFGFAHLHHAIEMKRNGDKTMKIFLICGFQCLYTTLFGYLTNRIFVNTGSLWCCFIAHSFCNLMGFPKLSVEGKIGWKIGYISLLVLGVYGFNRYFTRLTLAL